MQNALIIITAPSGSGKTTLVRSLLASFPELRFSISACTRSPRKGEKEGIDYYFLSLSDFQAKIKEHAFLEWEMVYPGKYYGTLNSEIKRIWDLHCLPLLDIDVKGALRVKKNFQGKSLSIFIKTPSLTVLKERLCKRGTESEETLAERLGKAEEELSYTSEFDYQLINDDLEVAKQELTDVVKAFIRS